MPRSCPAALRYGALAFVWLAVSGVAAYAAASASDATVQMPVVTADMREYSLLRYIGYFFGAAYEIAVQFFILQTGLSAYMRDRAERDAKNPVMQFTLYLMALYVVICLSMAPIAYLSSYLMEHVFHLSQQSFLSWLADLIKMAALGFLLLFPLVGSLFFLVRKMPRQWPIVFCLVASAWVGIGTFISPILLEPVLNKFTVMPDGALKTSIEQLAAKAGAPDAPIFVADKSKQTNKLNAYVSGLGGSTHVVIWDTTLKNLPDDQILSIVGHELGHYYLHHVYLDFFISVAINILLVPFNMYLLRPYIARLPKRWGIRGLEDFAVLPALILTLTICGFLFDPIANAWSRKQEHDADAFSLRVTENGPALARAFVALSQQNLSEPDPPRFIEFWLFSHPSLKDRINFALGHESQ
ncbi:MAG TPA: M48 family metallopeptidase [Trichormus sp.]